MIKHLCIVLACLGIAHAESDPHPAIHVKYIEVAELLPRIQALMDVSTSEEDKKSFRLDAVESANTIVVKGSAEQYALVRRLIAKVDQRPEQVYVSAVIAEIEIDHEKPNALLEVDTVERGKKSIALKKYRRAGFGGTILDVASAEADSGAPGTFLDTYIGALEKFEGFRVTSRPFLVTGNNQAASIAASDDLDFEVTPLINPDKQVTLGIDLKLDDGAQRFKTTMRIAQHDLAILTLGKFKSKDGSEWQRLLFIQPKPLDDIKSLPAPETLPVPKAKPKNPNPKPAEVEAKDNFLKRELKYLPVSEAVPVVAKALAELSGAEVDAQSDEEDPVVVGQTVIVPDSRLNSLIVGPSEHLDKIDELLDEVDVRPRQVFVDVSVIEVSLDEELKFGVDILREGTFARVDLGDKIEDGVDILTRIESLDQGDESETVKVSGAVATSGAANFQLEAVNGKGGLELYTSALAASSKKVRILAAPRLIAANNSQSFIKVSEGLQLELLPLIHWNDEVTLNIEVESHSGEGDQRRYQALNTMVRLQGGNAMAIGGIVREYEDGGRKELLLLVRPTIISE